MGISARHCWRPQLPDQPTNRADRQQDEKSQQHHAGQADQYKDHLTEYPDSLVHSTPLFKERRRQPLPLGYLRPDCDL
jgi:hypothetical protein